MQTVYLHKKVYQINQIDESEYPEIVYKRLDKINLFKKLRAQGCDEETALEAISMSRSAFYRWKQRYKLSGLAGLENESKRPNNVRKPSYDRKTEGLVLQMRRKYNCFGKYKIAIMIKREHGVIVSVSTVGRIITEALLRGTIKSVAYYFRVKEKKPRMFNDHAQRLKAGTKAEGPGDLVEVDHMTVQLDGIIIKHFKAICPITKIVVEQAYRSATSNVAAEFLNKIIAEFPFAIKSFQVDGGSEFMGEFEKECKALSIPLFVLPPRSPELNGTVERGNSTVKYEFYQQYDGPPKLESVQLRLQSFVKFYNFTRPHQTLNYLTPFEYYSAMSKPAPQSHML